MDRETLSSYGWIIITVIVIAAMITLAATLGDEIVEAITGAVNGLTEAGSSALAG